MLSLQFDLTRFTTLRTPISPHILPTVGASGGIHISEYIHEFEACCIQPSGKICASNLTPAGSAVSNGVPFDVGQRQMRPSRQGCCGETKNGAVIFLTVRARF